MWIGAYTVHRLDRETSGLLIFAKSEAVQLKIKNNWKAVEKHDTAVVHGSLNEKSGKFIPTGTAHLQPAPAGKPARPQWS